MSDAQKSVPSLLRSIESQCSSQMEQIVIGTEESNVCFEHEEKREDRNISNNEAEEPDWKKRRDKNNRSSQIAKTKSDREMASDPRDIDWVMLKHVLRYVKGSLDYKLCYRKGDGELKITGFSD